MNLSGLGYLAGGVNQGLDSASRRRLEDLAAASQQTSAQGDTVLGKALIQAYGGSPNPAQSPQISGLSKLASMFGGQTPPPSSGGPSPNVAGQPGPMALAPQAGPPGAPPPTPQVPTQPPGGPPQPAAGAQSGPTPQQAAAIKQLDFPSLVQLIAKSGAPPAAIAQAMEKLVPYMNAQAMQQYRMTMMQLAPQRLAETQRHDQATEGAATGRLAETGRHNLETEGLSKDREARLTVQFSDNLKIAKQKISNAEHATTKREQQSALVDAERERKNAENLLQNELIYGASDPDAEKKKAKFQAQLDDAQQRIDEVRKQIESQPEHWEGDTQGRPAPEVTQGRRLETSQEPAGKKTPGKLQPMPAAGLAKAKAAIADGTSREALIKQLQDAGFDTTGL